MTYPLVAQLAVGGVWIVSSCRVLGFSPQAFCRWKAQPYSDRDWHDGHLVNAVLDIDVEDPEFGYRFITNELKRSSWEVSENWVQRLCQENMISSTTTRKQGLSCRAGPPVQDDLLDRDFTAQEPNKRWVGDISEYPSE